MHKGTPAELHRNVITVYGGVRQWKEFVAYQGEGDAYLLLLDHDGKVGWTHNSNFDEIRFQELTGAVAKLSDTPAP